MLFGELVCTRDRQPARRVAARRFSWMYLVVVDWVGPVVSEIKHEYVDERHAVLSHGERRSFSQSALGVPASCTNEPKGEAQRLPSAELCCQMQSRD